MLVNVTRSFALEDETRAISVSPSPTYRSPAGPTATTWVLPIATWDAGQSFPAQVPFTFPAMKWVIPDGLTRRTVLLPKSAMKRVESGATAIENSGKEKPALVAG